MPLGGIPWAVWNASRLVVVWLEKMPVVSWLGTALARCSCSHRT